MKTIIIILILSLIIWLIKKRMLNIPCNYKKRKKYR